MFGYALNEYGFGKNNALFIDIDDSSKRFNIVLSFRYCILYFEIVIEQKYCKLYWLS